MHLFYRPEYAVGAGALAALLAGYVCFSLFNIAGTIINGAGKTWPTLIIGALTLAVGDRRQLVDHQDLMLASGGDVLLGAALATAGAMLFGVLLSGVYLKRLFGVFVPLTTVARVALSTAAALAVAHFWPSHGMLGGKLGTLISSSVIGAVYLGVAVISGELRPAELMRLRRGA